MRHRSLFEFFTYVKRAEGYWCSTYNVRFGSKAPLRDWPPTTTIAIVEMIFVVLDVDGFQSEVLVGYPSVPEKPDISWSVRRRLVADQGKFHTNRSQAPEGQPDRLGAVMPVDRAAKAVSPV